MGRGVKPIMVGSVPYKSARIAAEAMGISETYFRTLLARAKIIADFKYKGEVIKYIPLEHYKELIAKAPKIKRKPEPLPKSEVLIRNPCTHRLGVYNGQRS